MTNIPSIDANRAINSKAATYNAVKIQINEPKTNLPEGFSSNPLDNGIYNAVDIEVNKPSVESANKHNHHHVYDYPCAECMVTSKFAPIHTVEIPTLTLPSAYHTNRLINNKAIINTELELENKEKNTIPEPNIVKVEDQKVTPKEVVFNGLNFKANEPKHSVEIVPPEDIKPIVDVPKVISNLSDENFDIQAKQMEEIARVSMEDPQKAVPYIVTEIFTELINIVKKDSSDLAPPSQRQIELREQIMINELVKEQARAKKQDLSTIELPYKLTEKDFKEASTLSSMEQAEGNKEYALYTMAILSKVYTDEVHRHTGNVVPLTDMPGVSAIVDSLRNDPNSGVKIAAIDALRYVNREEYKEEISSVLEIATKDSNPYVARNAAVAMDSLN